MITAISLIGFISAYANFATIEDVCKSSFAVREARGPSHIMDTPLYSGGKVVSEASLSELLSVVYDAKVETSDSAKSLTIIESKPSKVVQVESERRRALWRSISDRIRSEFANLATPDAWAAKLRSDIDRADMSSEFLRSTQYSIPLNSIVSTVVADNWQDLFQASKLGDTTSYWLGRFDPSNKARSIPEVALKRLTELSKVVASFPDYSASDKEETRIAWKHLISALQKELPAGIAISITELDDRLEVYSTYFDASGELIDRSRFELMGKVIAPRKFEIPKALEDLLEPVRVPQAVLTWMELIRSPKVSSTALINSKLDPDALNLLISALMSKGSGESASYACIPTELFLDIAAKVTSNGVLNRRYFWELALEVVEAKKTQDGTLLMWPKHLILENQRSVDSLSLKNFCLNRNVKDAVYGLDLGRLLSKGTPGRLHSPIARAVHSLMQLHRAKLFFHEWPAFAVIAAFEEDRRDLSSESVSWLKYLVGSVGFHSINGRSGYSALFCNYQMQSEIEGRRFEVVVPARETPVFRLDPTRDHSERAGKVQRELSLEMWNTYSRESQGSDVPFYGHYFKGSALRYTVRLRTRGEREVVVECTDTSRFSSLSELMGKLSNIAASESRVL